MVDTAQTMTVREAMDRGRRLRSQTAWRFGYAAFTVVKSLFGVKAARRAKATALKSCTV